MICISFSGIDGAGKSTQIHALHSRLYNAGIRVLQLEFWRDIVVFPRLREFMTHNLFRGDKGTGSPDKPIRRRDKDVRAWYATVARLFFYLLDAIHLRLVLNRRSVRRADVVIVDRYIYDELANLRLDSRFMRAYARLLLKLAPAPALAFLIDAVPEAARLRKPEYPLEFLHANRAAYLALSEMVEQMTLVEPLAPKAAEGRIAERMLSGLRSDRRFRELRNSLT